MLESPRGLSPLREFLDRCPRVPSFAIPGNWEYTSGVPLNTPSGIMRGQYTMEDNDGALFDIDVPAFSLDSPHQAVRLN